MVAIFQQLVERFQHAGRVGHGGEPISLATNQSP